MSSLLALAERFVSTVKRGVDNSDSPHQILHAVSAIRNEVRGPEPAPLVPAEIGVAPATVEPEEDGEKEETLAGRIAKATGKELDAIAEERGLTFPAGMRKVADKRGWLAEVVEKIVDPGAHFTVTSATPGFGEATTTSSGSDTEVTITEGPGKE